LIQTKWLNLIKRICPGEANPAGWRKVGKIIYAKNRFIRRANFKIVKMFGVFNFALMTKSKAFE